ncbi:hypothetical protein [Hyphomicrobium sp. DY-1]|uniref:hypothetical protein n=1 Tax=Hyphomicrobium sp. DY-1 TaxID=3075650 RepID=UPI0039C3BF99
MTPVKQRNKHDPENGIYGDCHRAAIATVLDLDIDAVPHFADGDPGDLIFATREQEFLRAHGLFPIAFPFNVVEGQSLDEILDMIGRLNGDDFVYLLGGKSRTGVNHTVVCQGGRIAHDPSPRDAGIVAPCDDGFYWLTFFSDLRVSRPSLREKAA